VQTKVKVLGSLFIASLLLSCDTSYFLQIPRKAFVKIKKRATFTVCKRKTKKNKKESCSKKPVATLHATASGSIIAVNSLGSFILTAEHVCEEVHEQQNLIDLAEKMLTTGKKEFLKTETIFRAVSFTGQVVVLDFIAADKKIDACILFAENLFAKPIKRYYGQLQPGEKYYNVAAPAGVFEPGVVPIFDGYYLGEKDKNNTMFTIPAMGGSSGSPIVDSRGRLVGVVHSVIRRFHEISLSSHLKPLNKFIDEYIEDYYDKWHRNMLKLTRPK